MRNKRPKVSLTYKWLRDSDQCVVYDARTLRPYQTCDSADEAERVIQALEPLLNLRIKV